MEEHYPPSGYSAPLPPTSPPSSQYVGNGKDMTAFLAMLAGAGLLVTSCVPGASCLLPFFALIGGIVALRGADQAINPSRTRTYAWVAIITGAVIILLAVAFITLYGAFLVTIFREAQNQNFSP